MFFIDGCSAISCDFAVFLRGVELKSFYSTVFSRIEGLLVVCMLAVYFLSVCAGCYPLVIGHTGTVALACSQDSGGRAHHLLTDFLWAGTLHTISGQPGQGLLPAPWSCSGGQYPPLEPMMAAATRACTQGSCRWCPIAWESSQGKKLL